MTINRRLWMALPLATPALAQPERAVTLVVPFSPGGAADIAARTLAQYAPRLAGRPLTIVVDNRAGASGAIGTQLVARARPDGYTLLLARVGSSAILPATDPRTPFAWDDFTFLGLLDENPFVIGVRADAPWRDLSALLAAIRANRGQFNFPTSGPATVLDLGIRQMFVAAGLELDAATAIPFRGGGEAVAALLGGQAQFIGNNLSELLAQVQQGAVRALAVSSRERFPALPDVPTVREAGFPVLEQLAGWNALAGPPGLPEEVTAFWVGVLGRLAQDEGWLATTRRLGSVPRVLSPADTRTYVGEQVEIYRALARRLGLG
jgi:tripartite-type tricarboxylate transporter receptor subunit TctC